MADGATLLCTHEIVNYSWSVQGHLFTNTFKLLPLTCYDAILGMEWLETHSPMQIEWKNKWLNFTHQGQLIKLSGISDDPKTCPEVTVHQLTAMTKADAIWGVVEFYAAIADSEVSTDVPPEITHLVSQFPELFFEPTGIPPSRSLTHTHTHYSTNCWCSTISVKTIQIHSLSEG